MAQLRLLLGAALVVLLANAAVADDCYICNADKSSCDVKGVATLSGSPNYIQGHNVKTCADAYPLVSCGECKNGAAKKGLDCCTLACKEDGLGNVKAHCLCGPPQDNPGEDHTGQMQQIGVCADPHFRGAYGIQYDFHGVPDKDFNLISDQGLTVNAHFIGQDGLETGLDGTWMSALGFLWMEQNGVRSATITVKEGEAAYSESVPFDIEIDGQPLHPEAFIASVLSQDSVLFEDEGLTIRVAPFAYSYRVSIKHHIDIIVTAATHEFPAGNHIDIGISKLNVTGTVHGALGQTFAAARAESLKAAAAMIGTGLKFDETDIVEGKDADYRTSGLLKADFKFNRFNPQASVLAKLDVITRKLLGFRAALIEDEATGQLSCKNKKGGGLRCFN